MSEHFGKVHHADFPTVSDRSLRILAGLRMMDLDNDGIVEISHAQLAEKINVSWRTVLRGVQELVKSGVLEQQGDSGKKNIFTIKRTPLTTTDKPPLTTTDKPPLTTTDRQKATTDSSGRGDNHCQPLTKPLTTEANDHCQATTDRQVPQTIRKLGVGELGGEGKPPTPLPASKPGQETRTGNQEPDQGRLIALFALDAFEKRSGLKIKIKPEDVDKDSLDDLEALSKGHGIDFFQEVENFIDWYLLENQGERWVGPRNCFDHRTVENFLNFQTEKAPGMQERVVTDSEIVVCIQKLGGFIKNARDTKTPRAQECANNLTTVLKRHQSHPGLALVEFVENYERNPVVPHNGKKVSA